MLDFGGGRNNRTRLKQAPSLPMDWHARQNVLNVLEHTGPPRATAQETTHDRRQLRKSRHRKVTTLVPRTTEAPKPSQPMMSLMPELVVPGLGETASTGPRHRASTRASLQIRLHSTTFSKGCCMRCLLHLLSHVQVPKVMAQGLRQTRLALKTISFGCVQAVACFFCFLIFLQPLTKKKGWQIHPLQTCHLVASEDNNTDWSKQRARIHSGRHFLAVIWWGVVPWNRKLRRSS
jgi:hypothetical protein